MGTREVAPLQVGLAYLGLHHQLHRVVDQAMASAGLSLARAKVLMRLAENGPMNQAKLAGLLGYAPRSVTETVDALERDGLVERACCEQDRRARIVSLTEAGREACESAHVVRTKVMDEIFGSLSAKERGMLLALLEKVADQVATGDSAHE